MEFVCIYNGLGDLGFYIDIQDKQLYFFILLMQRFFIPFTTAT